MLRRRNRKVLLVEKEPDLLQRASYRNQARIHGGYHYPRSLTTALRSSRNCGTFMATFPECVVSEFDQVYAVARHHSKVSAAQFVNAMKLVGAPLAPAPARIRALFNSSLIEEVFVVREPVFNARILKEVIQKQLQEADVEIVFNTTVASVSAGKPLVVQAITAGGREVEWTAETVFNCTYNEANHLLHASRLPLIPLRYELTEMALIQPPPELENMGITVMCGPFFSVMPFPDRQLHTLSHVRYTPHYSWEDREDTTFRKILLDSFQRDTNFLFMQKDAARYVPSLEKAVYCDSLWEIKTLLPLNDIDDGRPILFARSSLLPGLFTVIGGKLDNVFDIAAEVDAVLSKPCH